MEVWQLVGDLSWACLRGHVPQTTIMVMELEFLELEYVAFPKNVQLLVDSIILNVVIILILVTLLQVLVLVHSYVAGELDQKRNLSSHYHCGYLVHVMNQILTFQVPVLQNRPQNQKLHQDLEHHYSSEEVFLEILRIFSMVLLISLVIQPIQARQSRNHHRNPQMDHHSSVFLFLISFLQVHHQFLFHLELFLLIFQEDLRNQSHHRQNHQKGHQLAPWLTIQVQMVQQPHLNHQN